jgi:nucleoside-diphosphate-sugar epimerase
MNIIITGAAGGIGSTLADYLKSQGHKLTLIDNLRNGYIENISDVSHFFPVSVCDGQLHIMLRGKQYDCIIHLAAVTALPDCESNVQECLRINVEGTANILETARKLNIPHVIFASTSAVYESNKEYEFTEDLEVSPRLWYSLSKRMAEEVCESYVKNYDLNITILRFFNVFGPKQDIYRKNPPLINYLVKQLRANEAPVLHSNGEQLRDYVHVNDVTRMIDLCLDKKPNDTFNVCSGEVLSVKQIGSYVQEALGTSIEPIYREADKLWDTYPQLFEGEYPLKKEIVQKETNKYSKGSYKKAERILGWKPNTNLEALIKTVATQIK